MEVTAESNDSFLAFRRLLYSLSMQLTSDDIRAIVFLNFFNQKDSLDVNALDVLCKLESQGIATYQNPDKLHELMKDLKRYDLAGEVKDYIKKKKSRSNDKKTSGIKKKSSNVEDIEAEVESENDLELRAMLEAAFVQATVLLQQIEKLQNSTSGKAVVWSIVKQVVTEAAQTSEALAERLRKAEARGNWGNKLREFEGYGGYREQVTQETDPKVHISTRSHSDHMLATSSKEPTDLNDSSRVKGNIQRKTSVNVLSKIQGEDNLEDDDEDDYETMKPGVSANNLLSWTEKRGSSTQSRECNIPRPYNISPNLLTTKPVKYVSVMLNPDPNDRSSLLPSQSTTSTTADNRAGHFRGSPVLEMSGNCRTYPKRWTRVIPEECSSLQPITTDPKWAKPHNNGSRRNSTQACATVGTASSHAARNCFASSPHFLNMSEQRPLCEDDEYITLHPTKSHEGGDWTVVTNPTRHTSLPPAPSPSPLADPSIRVHHTTMTRPN